MRMLKITKPIEVPKNIIVEYGGGKFYFRVPTDLDKFDLLTAEKTSERIKATFGTLEKIENVVDENDKPISPSAILDLLNIEQISVIMMERNKIMAELEKQLEADSKN
jgi:hypothetical protein